MDSHLSLVGLMTAILAVWRLTHLFWGEDGPWNLFVRFRRLCGNGFWGKLLDCFYCLSLWMALPVSLLIVASWRDRIILWLAVSGGAILLERISSRPAPAAPLPVWEQTPGVEQNKPIDN